MISELRLHSNRPKKTVDITLNQLTKVNYLVGENGCGKTRVLEYIHKNWPEQSLMIKDGLGRTEVNQITRQGIKAKRVMSEKRLIVPEYFKDEREAAKNSWLKKTMREIGIEPDSKVIDLEALNGGERKLKKYLEIARFATEKKFSILVIEEPETHLHPSLQKKLPHLLELVSAKFKLQIFVATHSPFIIATSGELSQKQKDDFLISQDDRGFEPSQKVYFLKNGTTANKNGRVGIDESGVRSGSFGYWGRKCGYIAGKMLGAGLEDFITPQDYSMNIDAPILIFCEGQGVLEDAKIYNIIFKEHLPPVLFASSRGNSQLYKTYELVSGVRQGLSANLQIWMLRDRDHEYASLAEIKEFQTLNPGTKILYRRALECYLYNSETARLLLQEQGLQINRYAARLLDHLQAQIQKEAEQGIQGSDYKYRLREVFKIALADYRFSKKVPLEEKIAGVITPLTRTYWELRRAIFN